MSISCPSYLNLERSPLVPGLSEERFRQPCLQNPEFRAMHQYVFCGELRRQMCGCVGLRALIALFERPYHIILLAQKT